MKQNVLIKARNLHKRFGSKVILQGIDLEVYAGETLVLLGASGSGKSVLTKHMIGLLTPDQGSVSVDGDLLPYGKERQLAKVRRKMGIMFQNGALFDSLNVEDNVAFPLREHSNLSESETLKLVTQALEIVRLAEEHHKMPSDLSGGMRKRVALARAIVDKPQAVIYDEPHAGLDPITADVIDHLIKRLEVEHGMTNIVITHELRSVFRIATRIAFVKEGRIYWQGAPDALKKSDDPVLAHFLEGRSSEGSWDSK